MPKLIEVSLPLEQINKESAREKSIRHGHPSTLHLWWARRPLAACRAVLFAQLVDDPSSYPHLFPTEEAQVEERERLFEIIRRLVKWENINDVALLAEARAEIVRCAPPDGVPPALDPFAGGGSIPLEAQRLGLVAHARDLNPVAVLINKALIEIPPRWVHRTPLCASADSIQAAWQGAKGLAADVRHYGAWMRQEAEKRIGRFYPSIPLPDGSNDTATVIAWLWARTVPSPNPAAHGTPVPLVRSFVLSSKKGKEVWVEPIVDAVNLTYRFEVRSGAGKPPSGTIISRKGGVCLLTGSAMPFEYIRAEGQAGRMGARLMAIVAEGKKGRVYLSPDQYHAQIAESAMPTWKPEAKLTNNPRDFKTPNYGLTHFRDLFTNRQLVALTTFSDLVGEAQLRVRADAVQAGWSEADGEEYGRAIATYLGLAVSRSANRMSTICFWDTGGANVQQVFGRQAIPMTWDFAEANLISDSSGSWESNIRYVALNIENLGNGLTGQVKQHNAAEPYNASNSLIISTDPPYYDNIGYADLSDFFYVWLRRSLAPFYPELFGTLLVPKTPELVATPHRFEGSKARAKAFFETGLGEAFAQMREACHPAYPLTIFYAFKQSETKEEASEIDLDEEEEENQIAATREEATASTGWETMLQGLITARLQITGTWPMRTERTSRSIGLGSNALASSIVLVCRPLPAHARSTSRRAFLQALKQELPRALHLLKQGNLPPVDLAQASIGPGMAIFSRYKSVLETDGSQMSVRTALALINKVMDAHLNEEEGVLDPESRWAVAWFEQYRFDAGSYGEAETLSKAKNASVQGIVEAGILQSGGGKVKLLNYEALDKAWQPSADKRLTVWEVTHQLIRMLESEGLELAAAKLKSAEIGEAPRDLAYRLYVLCERKGWTQEAIAYNTLVVNWVDLMRQIGRSENEAVQKKANI